MTSALVALAGASRSGKGTVAQVLREEAEKAGLTSFERQFSDNGKWGLARIFSPSMTRVEAVKFFEALKGLDQVEVNISMMRQGVRDIFFNVPLQQFLQHGLQEGGRDLFGDDLHTDRILARSNWLDSFFDAEAAVEPTDVAIISDLRQVNEAQRVIDCGGLVVDVWRPENDDEYRTNKAHQTERRLPDDCVHHVIVNDGSLVDLEEAARKLWGSLQERPRISENFKHGRAC